MSLAKEEDIEEFSSRVKEVLGERLEEILLFGSYAKDEYVPGSDVDLLLLVSERRDEDEKKIWDLVDETLAEKDIRFSPKIYLKKEFEDKVEKGFSFYKEVSEEGVRI